MSEFLSKAQRLKLDALLQAKAPPRVGCIPKRNTEAPAPLSPAQKRFCFLHHLEPSKGQFNTPAGISIRGALDTSILELGFRMVVRRHEILRTIFPSPGGEPAQQILANFDPPFLQCDVSNLAPEEREHAAEAIVTAESKRPFTIESEPCVRCFTIRLSPTLHWVLLVAHHIIFDTWSMGIFSKELFGAYDALVAGTQPSLPELDITYADYAFWEASPENRRAQEAQLQYWKTRLGDALEVQRLPLDRPRGQAGSRQGGTEFFNFSPELTAALETLARTEGVSLYTALLAILKMLLFRYTGERDVIVGSAASNRRVPQLETLIGCFMNTLLLRTQISPELSFRELLRAVSRTVLEAHDNSSVPLEEVVTALNPPRNLSYSPYAQVMLIVQNAALDVPVASGLELERLAIADRLVPQQDLVFHVRPGRERMGVLAEYNAALFNPSTVKGMLTHLQEIAGAVTRNPETRVSELEMMTDSDKCAYAIVSQPSPTGVSRSMSVAETVAREAAAEPGRIAVTCGGNEASYGWLNTRSDDIESRLAAIHAGRGSIIAVCLERSPDLVAVLIAIQKVGAAYIAIDPCLPTARVRTATRHLPIAAVLTEDRFRHVTARWNALTLTIDSEGVGREGIDPPDRTPGPGDVALIGESAGVTGHPNHVIGSYAWLAAAPCIAGRGDTVFVFAPPTTAVFAAELFPAIQAGARIVLAPKGDLALGSLLTTERCTVVHAPPLILRELAEDNRPDLRGVRIVSRSEVMPVKLAAALRDRGAILINAYGSAEGGPMMSVSPMRPEDPSAFGPAEGGGARMHVLHSHCNPVPPGVPGQLFLSGETLAMGYLANAALTAERFLPDPFSSRPGARMFKTGDAVLYTDTGQLRFLGRWQLYTQLDDRTVDLGYTEGILRKHPAVAQAIAVARTTPSGKRLAVYVVPQSEVGSKELREFLKRHLPSSLLPRDIVLLKDSPLDPTGLIDRRELPDPQSSSDSPAYQAPLSSTEIALAAIWSSLLEREPIGRRDDFFEIGGDSLLMQRMVTRIEGSLGVTLPMHVAFASPTIADVAVHIDRVKRLGMTDEEELAQLVNNLTDTEVQLLLEAQSVGLARSTKP